jgi:polyphenol oxidase
VSSTASAPAGWRLDPVDGLLLLRCEALEAVPGLAHAFSTRIADGGDGFDLGPADPTGSAFESRRERFLRAAGFGLSRAAVLRQVHGGRLLSVPRQYQAPPEADGWVWSRESPEAVVPAVRTADCVALILADRAGRAAAIVHAGWRGTAVRIAAGAVEALLSLGARPGDLVAALGPAIGGCCYEVSEDTAAVVDAASVGDHPVTRRDGARPNLDLHAANRNQLVGAGVPPGAVHAVAWCTRCRGDLFFSWRREGERAGRLMAAAGSRAR